MRSRGKWMAPEGGSRNGKRKVRELGNRHQANPTVQTVPRVQTLAPLTRRSPRRTIAALLLVGPLVNFEPRVVRILRSEVLPCDKKSSGFPPVAFWLSSACARFSRQAQRPRAKKRFSIRSLPVPTADILPQT